jgi:ubiquinol-cytochrome c reductase iron-sulfur subunit
MRKKMAAILESNIAANKKKVSPQKNRRDFLILATGALGAVGVGSFIYPLIKSMNPARDVLAASTIEINLKPVAEGQAITVLWRGKPLFIRRRTEKEIQTARSVPLKDLLDPQTDQDRFKTHPQWLVVVGVCTHLGCVPLGQKPTDNKGEYGGWLCPCHGSEYDISGRVRRGPAPRNLEVPPYTFLNDTTIRVG